MTQRAIKISGLSEFVANLGKVDAAMQGMVKGVLDQVANEIIGIAKPKIPRRSGKARASLRPRSTPTDVRIQEGSKEAPYVPWLDFGGRVGRKRSVRRPFLKDGRYVYKAYLDNKDQLAVTMQAALTKLVESSGIEVNNG